MEIFVVINRRSGDRKKLVSTYISDVCRDELLPAVPPGFATKALFYGETN